MTNEVVALLSEAQELIRDPKNWCQDALSALFKAWERIDEDWDHAVLRNAWSALHATSQNMGYLGINDLNDKTNYDTVMKMFDLTKELAAQEGEA